MSFFSDFQKAWAQRFPGCELPQAWEEDARANLATHRHKVALLREELEKEEFYVEYLERLLADVDRVKRSVTATKEQVTESELLTIQGQNGGPEVGSLVTTVSTSSSYSLNLDPGNLSSSFISSKTDTTSDKQHCVSTSSLTEDALMHASYISDTKSPGVKDVSTGDHEENYVTVIEVGGSFDTKSTDSMNEKDVLTPVGHGVQNAQAGRPVSTLSQNEAYQMPMHRKKKPPAPPKPRRPIPVQAVPPVKKVSDTELIRDNSMDSSLENKSNSLSLEKLDEQSVGENTDGNVLVISGGKPLFSTFKPVVSIHPMKHDISRSFQSSNESTLTPEERLEKITKANTSEEQNKPVLYEDYQNAYADEQVIYDTVAPDEDVILSAEDGLLACGSANGIADAEEDEVEDDDEDEDTEGDYVVFSERAVAAHHLISQENMQNSQVSATEGEPSNSQLQKDHGDRSSPEYATYMNIDYFLQSKKVKFGAVSQGESFAADSDEEEPYLARSFSSDQELDVDSTPEQTAVKPEIQGHSSNDDVFDVDSGVYSSSVESASFLCTSGPSTPPSAKKHDIEDEIHEESLRKAEAERMTMYKCILSSIVESETIYVDCLNLLLQYMKALKSTIGTSQPLLSMEDFTSIFFKIPELHTIHLNFLQGLKKQSENWDGKESIGDHFKILASKLGVYAAFLQNYSKAIESVRKCSIGNAKFSEITKSIKLKSLQGQATTLEDLLHKPVARVQKNALVLHDLLRYTPESHPDYKTLRTALKMTQCFLNDLNMSATENMFPATDRAQRHLVKNSFIIELSEGHRKLRHLFLFSDVIVCAKYKPSTRQKFTFEVKWYIPLAEVIVPEPEVESESVRECSPVDVLALKSRASNVRDQILKEERVNQSKDKPKVAGRNLDKHKKKLAELEAQLVLASPNLIFRVGQKNGKLYTFFLSSEFDRAQWMEAISILQTSAPTSAPPLSPYELQPWVTSCRKHLGTNLGSFLLRSGKDEELLLGDLHILVNGLHGLTRPADVYLCFEVDSYGHFFNKAKTKVCHNTVEPQFNQDFIIELEGSETLRILCYEEHPGQGAILRGKGALELSRSWLTDKMQEKSVSLQEFMLTLSLKFVPPELTLRRVPSSKNAGVFGVKIQQVCKKEKAPIPFIITSCVREVEKRGMSEVGIYRVSGSASDVQRLKKTFETNVYEAEQLLKEVDIHSVTGLFKLYFRELPEALFTDNPKFFQAFNLPEPEEKKKQLLALFDSLPPVNQVIIRFLLDHMVRVNKHESTNKMSLHNLATVFGPTVLRPVSNSSSTAPIDLLTASTVDVMAQAGIFYFFLKRHAAGLPLNSDTQE